MRIDKSGKFELDKMRPYESDMYKGILWSVICFAISCGALSSVMSNEKVLDDVCLELFFFGALTILFIAGTIASYDKWKGKIEISEEGIWPKFPRRSPEFIPWDEFQQVCVCYDEWGSNKTGMYYYVVIGFIKHGVRKLESGRWEIGPFNYRKAISLDYTYELYEEVKAKCPLGVLDLRDTPEYAIK